MQRRELLDLAEILRRHLATVLASERGFREGACPDCRGAKGARPRTAPERSLVECGDSELAGAVSAVRRAAPAPDSCPTCEGGRRLWSKTTAGVVRRMSDRQVIEVFAGDSPVRRSRCE